MNERFIPVREKRTYALSHFHGTAAELSAQTSAELSQRLRTFSQAGGDEITAALCVLATIRDAAVIVNGAGGCALAAAAFRGIGGAKIFSSNLSERETILGGDGKLRQTVLETAQGNPKIIFIVGTPVTAISNDDVNSVISELSDDVNAKLVFIKVDGFQSKTVVNGYDVVSHAILRHVTENGDGGGFVNLIAMSESLADITEITNILSDLSVCFNLLPRFANADGLTRAGMAEATLALDRGESSVLAEGLQQRFGVKYADASVPIGAAATREWITALGTALGKDFSEYATRQEAAAAQIIASQPLKGKRVFAQASLNAAVNVASLVRELGGTMSGFALDYIDENNYKLIDKLTDEPEKVTVMVGVGQPFELVNTLTKNPADVYIGTFAEAAASAGALPFYTGGGRSLYGYGGYAALAHAADGAAFGFNGASGFYRHEWLRKSGNWYVKREVK